MNKKTCLLIVLIILPTITLAQVPEFTAGDTISIVLTAKDSSGNVITDWDQTGSIATLRLHNSTANTDTSARSWNADPIGYSWAMVYHNGQPLTQQSEYEWEVQPTLFVDGIVHLSFVHTKYSDSTVFFALDSGAETIEIDSSSFRFIPGPAANLLIEITSSLSDRNAVYVFRKYEVIVCPRDRYLNNFNEMVPVLFSSHFPGEFVNSLPDFSNLFYDTLYLRGCTNYFLASVATHVKGKDELQWINGFIVNDTTTSSRSDGYEILPHPPAGFSLSLPSDGTLLTYSTWNSPYEFTWEKSADPYTDIHISRFTTEVGNDIVRYTIHFLDSASLTRHTIISTDNSGLLNKWTTTHGGVRTMADSLTEATRNPAMIWYVEATDGLYVTRSNDPHPEIPQIGNRLSMYLPNPDYIVCIATAPTTFRLHQNYPNPFNPSTTIRFEIVERGHVTLRVFDLLGNQVAELANETLDPGVYSTEFNATGLASRVYTYILQTGTAVLRKSMVIEK